MKNIKIAVFYGGKITKHLVLIRAAARKMGAMPAGRQVSLDLVSYNSVYFETETGKIGLRDNPPKAGAFRRAGDYDVVFFRTTGKHWEEVDLIINQISKLKSQNRPVVVDPMAEKGKPSYACKAWQMLKLTEAGIPVPKTIYGSLWYLYEVMCQNSRQQSGKTDTDSRHRILSVLTPFGNTPRMIARGKIGGFESGLAFQFPVIVKGSGGDRGTRVFKANNLAELEKLVRDLRKTETEEGKRYMLQEYIENKGDYRVLILGKKVLGVMKRSRQSEGEFRNNFSVGGKVEVADLPEKIKKMAVRAAEVCGIAVAGVDVMPKGDGYVVLEVNKGPQFTGFMKVTGIDVPQEIVKFLVSLKK